jgi:D-arabinose 1-dehydrogenase-like Zn-dependent alcohol dehydrogenase
MKFYTGQRNRNIKNAEDSTIVDEALIKRELLTNLINEACERLLKGEVKYRFVIDMASLKK